MNLELACFTKNDAITAIACKADRIEYCHDYSLGGVSPCASDIVDLKESSDIPVYVMIRLRGGTFVYTKDEIMLMQQQINAMRIAGADGFVFGCLTADGLVDEYNNQLLIDYADGLPCTFHRAFDGVIAKHWAMESLITLGFSSVLTSGGPSNASDHTSVLRDLQKTFGNEIAIIVGGGVRASNIKDLVDETECSWYHSAARNTGNNSLSIDEAMRLKQILLQ